MVRESELMLYLLLGIPAVFVGLFLLFLGPVGWFLAVFLGVAVIGAAAVFGDSEADAPDRVNCPHCGSRTAADDTCDYCGESIHT
ncbi:MAG: zinc ribbon domain-containing protein [Haloplanus sp.]